VIGYGEGAKWRTTSAWSSCVRGGRSRVGN